MVKYAAKLMNVFSAEWQVTRGEQLVKLIYVGNRSDFNDLSYSMKNAQFINTVTRNHKKCLLAYDRQFHSPMRLHSSSIVFPPFLSIALVTSPNKTISSINRLALLLLSFA